MKINPDTFHRNYNKGIEVARDNGTLHLLEALRQPLFRLAVQTGCGASIRTSAEKAYGLGFCRKDRGSIALFQLWLTRLKDDVKGLAALSVNHLRLPPFVTPSLTELFDALSARTGQQLTKHSDYPSLAVGFVTEEQGLFIVDALSNFFREGERIWGQSVYGPETPDLQLMGKAAPGPHSSNLVADTSCGDCMAGATEVEANDDAPPPLVDARVWREIQDRRGQKKFRRTLLRAYGWQCAVTGCSAEDALEAAHLTRYSDEPNNSPSNGLLLRADIHTLFDLHLVSVDPHTFRVRLAENLMSAYPGLDGKELHLPEHPRLQPDRQRLQRHFDAWLARCAQ